MQPYTLQQIDRVRDAAEEGLTRTDIRLRTGIGFDDIDRIALLHNIRIRRGLCAVALATRGLPLKNKVMSLYTCHPSARLTLSDIMRCAGIQNTSGTSAQLAECLKQFVADGWLETTVGERMTPLYFRPAQEPSAAPEPSSTTKQLDFGRCDDIAAVRALLTEILDELRTLKGRIAHA